MSQNENSPSAQPGCAPVSGSQKFRSGRTTRMLKEALMLAGAGRKVYLMFNCVMEAERVKRTRMRELIGHEGRSLGISFETPDTLSNFNWQTMRLTAAHPNCIVLVDHYVIEIRFQKMLEMLSRFDSENAELSGRYRERNCESSRNDL